jgi:alpha-N-arabinofuranosidase
LVNVIAPIMTDDGGSAWRQTIYWPFYYASRFGRGTSMDIKVGCPKYANKEYGDVPFLDVSAILSEDNASLSLFCVNRAAEAMELDLKVAGLEALRPVERVELAGFDIKATNTAAAPDRVAPRNVAVDTGEISLPPLSYTFIRFAASGK